MQQLDETVSRWSSPMFACPTASGLQVMQRLQKGIAGNGSDRV